jgi:gamma-glutamyl-gamma-aminobutyrate hydrolase PuuD
MQRAGIPVESSKGEAWPGQHEINFRFSDAVTTADRHSIYKNGAKEIANQHGQAITFMAKPDHTWIGNSCHIHSSLWSPDGSHSLFVTENGHGPSPAFNGYLGGLAAHMRELSIFVAPNINSYKRYASESWAPTTLAWSYDNRTCGFRIVGHGNGFRVESRIPGADANPYLAFAAMIAAGLQGIETGSTRRRRSSRATHTPTNRCHASPQRSGRQSTSSRSRRWRGRHWATRLSITTSTTPGPNSGCSIRLSPAMNGSASSSGARPVVGITTYVTPAKWGSWELEAALVPVQYVQAVERAGGRPLLVPPSEEGIEETLEALDGLVFSGGSDLEPETYGQEAHTETAGIVRERDEAELALLSAALERDMPVLAICRGSQVLNVVLGGDLVQHLPEVVGDEKHMHTPGMFAEHDIDVEPGTRIGDLLGDSAPVKSHPQGQRQNGLTHLGGIEAVEDPPRWFVLAYQQHRGRKRLNCSRSSLVRLSSIALPIRRGVQRRLVRSSQDHRSRWPRCACVFQERDVPHRAQPRDGGTRRRTGRGRYRRG